MDYKAIRLKQALMDLKKHECNIGESMNKIPILKPCPFCGGKPQMLQDRRDGYKIRCLKCGVRFQQRVLKFSMEWLEETMINNWNTRHQQKEIDKLKTQLKETDHMATIAYMSVKEDCKAEIEKLRELLKKAGEGNHRCKELYDWYCKER